MTGHVQRDGGQSVPHHPGRDPEHRHQRRQRDSRVPLEARARNIVQVPGGGSATVGDRVWLDIDADGVFDPGETGIAGVEVTLKDQFGTPVQVTTTDSQGRYTFIDVAPDTGDFVQITGGLPRQA